jgi:GTPase
MPTPTIAIVGRPNVGKSSLLNALAGKLISIVQDMPGVTRDRVSTMVKVDGRYVEVVDTGGYGFIDPDALTDHIQQQIDLAMGHAALVLFLVDCHDGLTTADQDFALLLRKRGIKTVLVANKADTPHADVALAEFARLGFGTPIGISALNNRNIDQVLDAIRQNVDLRDAPTKIPEPQMMVAIVGKRNAGKSTLVNAIAEIYDGDPNRVIVSEVPGTTRDSVDVRFDKDGKSLIVIDTAGVRKKRQMIATDVEFYSFHRAQRSIRRADVVLMLIDGTEKVSEPDKKLAQYIADQFKPVILVVNKWDQVLENAKQQAAEHKTDFSDDLLMNEFREYLDQELRHLDYAPVAFVTAKDGRKVEALLNLCQHLFRQATERVTTGKLNRALRQILEERAPSTPRGRGGRVKIYYATQVEVSPPSIVLFVNNPDNVGEAYQRYMVNRFRELLPYPEVPIKLLVRPRGAGAAPREVEEIAEPKAPKGGKRPQYKRQKRTAKNTKRREGSRSRKR